jgi:peptidoglycan/LPS O-acetylase OafA/YrhL
MKITESRRLLELDALRGIAAMSVVFFHLGIKYQSESHEFFNFGVTGVDLFFIISGFVILMTLERTKSWKDFIISRVSRLYPAYWVCVSLTALLILIRGKLIPEFIHDNLLREYLFNLTMFQRWVGVKDLEGPYWTLIVELIFYAVMLAIFMLRQLKHIELIGAAALIPSVAIQIIGKYNPNMLSFEDTIYQLFRFYPLFLAGIIFYKMKVDRITLSRYVTIFACLTTQYVLVSGNRSIYISPQHYGLMLAIYGLLFILFVNNSLKFLVNKVTVFLGEISYSLYLVHWFLSYGIIIPGLMKYAHVNFWIASFGVALPICMIVAVLINRQVEKPLMAVIRAAYRSGTPT